MTKAGLRIHENFERVNIQLVKEFVGLPVANIGDSMNRLAAFDSSLVPVNDVPMLGSAFTVKVPEGDNLMFHKAMDLAKEGDVILIDSGGDKSRAILGELMAYYCFSKGIKGIVVDGCIRDRDVLKHMKLPIYAKGTSPNGPYKNGPGEINTPISIGGQVVHPGDIIVGDQDGIIAISPNDAESILEKAKKIQKEEEKIFETIKKDGTYNRPWVDKELKTLGYM